MQEDSLISLEKVSKKFPMPIAPSESTEGYFFALNEVSFSLKKNDFAVMAGANGSGKSLLMAIVAGLVKPSSGKVRRGASVGLVFQNPDTQILGETPWEDVSVGPRNQGFRKEPLYARVRQSLEQVALADKAHFPASSLSGGEKRRLAAAGILAMDREVIVFDEPYANLDYPGVRQTNALLRQLHGKGKTILVLTHELEKCLALANRFLVLYRGNLVFDGSPQEGLEQELESWAVRNPLQSYSKLDDLVWN